MSLKFLKKLNKNSVLIGVAVVAVIITAALIVSNSNGGFSLSLGSSDKKIAEKVINYINNNELAATPATLVEYSGVSGLVKITIKIGDNQFDSYATKDGRFLFPQAFDMMPEESDNSTASANVNTSPAEVVKTDKPILESFVVSMCPYGLQVQRAIAQAVKEMPSLNEYIKVRYIGDVSSDGKSITAMHGDEEAKENLRQICIREEEPAKYWNYVGCQMQAGDSSGCQSSAGIDSAKLNACVSDASRGVAYAKKDFDLSAKYGASGSPTMILNGTTISESGFGGRSADSIKSMICAGFNSQASFCSTSINTAQAAVAYSKTYEATAGSTDSSNVNCE